MSDGITHQKSDRKLIKWLFILLTISSIFSYYYIGSIIVQLYIGSLLGMIFGYLFGPDLDQQQLASINETEAPVYLYYKLRRLGVPYVIANSIKQILIWFNIIFWYPYGTRIPHRHYLSHSYVVSTLIREVYFFALTCGLYMLVYWTISPLIFIWTYKTAYLAFFISNSIIDANHLRLDGISLYDQVFKRKIK